MFESLMLLVGATVLLLGSPGPAPLALAASSATFGVRNSLPFLGGILAGLLAAIAGALFGVAALLKTAPQLALALQIIAALYIARIAWRIATAPVLSTAEQRQDKPGLLDGFILNLLNPKAYMAFLALFSQFLLPGEQEYLRYGLTALVCFGCAIVVDLGWLLAGGALRRVFSHPKWARTVRCLLALAMLATVLLGLLLWHS
ncbi:LysE family translocator [Shewanella cyperi]|uniref:LysE family translocator n=1 Tax=Shewanella cyperi TaxID=2814292 RepID=UPI001A950913|nr:LysE family translocator [Shewanella cyperi]QSX40594.1 LysE family translocator [Shewanella cyperi]